MTKQDKKALISYWLVSADEDWLTYLSLKRARRYAHALFFLHLTIEKLIKAAIVAETGAHAPMSHNLPFLLGKTKLIASEDHLQKLSMISTFNLNCRYPDEKLVFYKSIDLKASQHWHAVGVEIKKWLENSQKKN